MHVSSSSSCHLVGNGARGPAAAVVKITPPQHPHARPHHRVPAMPSAPPSHLGLSPVSTVESQSAPDSSADTPKYQIYNTYSVFHLLDTMIILGCGGLFICYGIARHLKHVGVYCDISDLVVHLPERVLFRVDFSIVGGTLLLGALPIRDVVARRVKSKLPNIAAMFQMLSGFGVVLVGACGPEEIEPCHVLAAILGFGGSGIAQLIYGCVLLHEDQPSPSARLIFKIRCCISVAFWSSAVIFGLATAGVFPEPTEHIFEWSMWYCLLAWYYTFRFDMTKPGEHFFLATVNELRQQPPTTFLTSSV